MGHQALVSTIEMNLFITIDTEYSSRLFRNGTARSCAENFARCVRCESADGDVGIHYQMDVLDRYGLKAVFFVDPMPALVWGPDAVRRMVQPILERGHDVQLHLHTEWLEFSQNPPVTSRTGKNLSDFSLDEQYHIIGYAMEQLEAAGAPAPVAFRAGNYGANDDTLRALARHGIALDTSFTPGLMASDCKISLPADTFLPTRHHGTREFPVGAIAGHGKATRHAQLTALSFWELTSAVKHAVRANWPAFVLVSHSFELVNRDRTIANHVVKRRFERFCDWLSCQAGVKSATFANHKRLEEALRPEARNVSLLPHNPLRTVARMIEQAGANLLYGGAAPARKRRSGGRVKSFGWGGAGLFTGWNETFQATSAMLFAV